METDAELLAAFREAVHAKIRRDLIEEARRAAELRDAILPAVRDAVGQARAAGACRRVWLFGSFAGGVWGYARAQSDVDLLVEGDEEAVAARVARATGREVHALAFDRAPASLVERVFSDGVPL